MVQSRSGRDHPLAKGGSLFEETPTNPPPSHTAAIFLAALALGAAAYASAGFINSGIDRLLSSPVIPIADVPSHTSNNIVNLGYASYRGLRNETVPSVVSWLGVPYAQPPRRFRAAQPLDETPREHNLKDLVQYPPFCVQGWAPWAGAEDRGGAGSEDCLFLNIYAPNIATNTSSLPVLVYIHGGGYHLVSNGNPRAWPFDNWVERSSTPFVAVSIYYRLSSLGFLAAPEGPDKGVHAGEDPELLLNAGLHDQRMALRFIQRHIHSFGGDPKRVTIMGQSAGAGSVGSHIVAQNENPDEQLFHRAILQSWYRAPLLNPAGRKTVWNYLINRVGCSHWSWGLSRTLQCLREVDHVKLIQAADEGMAKHPKDTDWMWQPVIDNRMFNDIPSRLIRSRTPIDIIVGHPTHDSVLSHATFSELAKATYPKLSSADIRMLENTYSQTDIAPEDIPEVAMSEAMFRCSSHFIGNKQGPRVYAYRFDEPDPVNYACAGHSADNYIMFEGTRSNGSVTFNPLAPSQRVLSDELISYFVKFAATGNPNAPHSMTGNVQATLAHASDAQEHISPIWPTYDTGKRIVFRAPEGGTGTSRGVPGATHIEEFDENEIERCKVWESLTEAIQI
ncbi:type-B carboxylesterase lipase family, partial [Rhizoctonia solani]